MGIPSELSCLTGLLQLDLIICGEMYSHDLQHLSTLTALTHLGLHSVREEWISIDGTWLLWCRCL